MREFLKSIRFKILLAFIAFLMGIMIYAVTRGGYSLSSVSFINTITKPFRFITNAVSMKIENTADSVNNSISYYEENKLLKQKIGELNKQLTEYEDLKEEVKELRKLVVIKEEHPDNVFSQSAEVLGYVANDPFKGFTIDRGYADGIKPYCPVITPEGLVGITIEVSQFTSTVRTILSPDLSVATVCSATNSDFGIVEGTVITAENNMTKLTHLTMNHEVKKGDLIVTSGSSGLFPKDYAVGTVTEIGVEANGLSAYAEIKPSVDISRLSSVFVIINFDKKKDINTKREEEKKAAMEAINEDKDNP
ncbi:MAG: rod shape-determining protein MreC [Ruminococcus sp.]|nr:rod shape-determining protein MreC [Ruminococcus sp.]